jgi:hypothetical protein
MKPLKCWFERPKRFNIGAYLGTNILGDTIMTHRDRRSRTPHSGEGQGIPHAGPSRPKNPHEVVEALLKDQVKINQAVVHYGVVGEGDNPVPLAEFGEALKRVFGEKEFKQRFKIALATLTADGEEGVTARAELLGSLKKSMSFRASVTEFVVDKRARIRSEPLTVRRVNRSPKG